jgi:hypothetical protein
MRLTWKLDEKETGLRRIGAGPRGSKLHDDQKTYATVAAIGGGMYGYATGWYWVAGWSSGVPHKNTCDTPNDTETQAKADAAKYVQAALNRRSLYRRMV